jgi:hypothetical protein
MNADMLVLLTRGLDDGISLTRLECRELIDVLRALDNAERERDAARSATPNVESWPAHWPKRYNGCSDPCDALFFACACGAFHDADEVAEFEREYGPRIQPATASDAEHEWQHGYESMCVVADELKAERDRALTAARELREALEKQAVHRVSRRGGERQWCQICDSYTAPYSPAREEWLKVTHASGCALASTAWLTDGGDNG